MRRLLPLMAGALVGCKTTEPGPWIFDSPVSADVLTLEDGGPFEEPVGFVSNLRSGRITPIDLKHATLLSDQPTAPWLDSRGVALGDERQLGDVIVWAPAEDQVRVMAVDLAHRVLAESPYVIGTDPVLTLQEPTATEPVFVDADGSGDAVTVSGLTLATGWTTTEDWLLETDGQVWWVTGSRSGRQGETATLGLPYRTEQHELAFTLDGSASSGDSITLSTETGVVEHDLGATPLALARLPGQPLALVGTWDDVAQTGALVLWDLAAQAAVGQVDLGEGAQPWEIEVATADSGRARVFVADSRIAQVHEIDLDLSTPAASTRTTIPTAGPVQDLAWLAGLDHQGQPFERLYVAPAGLNRVDLYDLAAGAWLDVNPMDGVEAAGMDLFAPVVGLDGVPDPLDVQTITPWGTYDSAWALALTLFDGSLVMMDAATGCLVTDIEGARLTLDNGEEDVDFTDRGEVSSPALQIDDATGRKVVTSTCGGLVRTETWTLIYDGARGDWRGDGSVSGEQVNRLVEDQRYVSDNGGFSMLLLSGPLPSTDGDQFTFYSEEGILRLDTIADAELGDTPFDAPAAPVVFQLDVGPTGGGWDQLDRRSYALLPLTGNDLVMRVRLRTWNVEVVWE